MIHFIGNSHVLAFGKMGFRTNHIGPVIAYNFFEHHFKKALAYINNIDKEDHITLIAGEVDCRLHIPMQADKQQRSDQEITQECVDRFFRCYIELMTQYFNPIVFGTHPTTTQEHNMSDPSNPVYGSCQRRNNICILWNDRLNYLCEETGLPFISIYDKLVDENNITKMDYYLDYCHLDPQKVKPLFEEELHNAKIQIT